MIEIVSQHNHSDMTNHGHAPLNDLVEHAYKIGMTNIAITEHYPLSRHVDPTNYVSMDKGRIPEYISTIKSLQQKYPSMEIVIGCELDWLGKDEDRSFSEHEFDIYDVILGSVHFLDLWPFDDPTKREYWQEMGPDYIWKRYFEVWTEAVISDAPFNVMAHPDLVKKFGYRPSFDPIKLYKQAAEAIASTNRMIEVNTSGKFYACKEIFPAPDLLKEFHHAGVLCTIGSDAHEVNHVNRCINDGYRLMYEAGYREVTVIQPGGSKRNIKLA